MSKTSKEIVELMEKLSAELVDRGLLIEAGWIMFRMTDMMLPNKCWAPAKNAIRMSLDEDDEPTEQDLKRIDLINAELEKFADEMRHAVAAGEGTCMKLGETFRVPDNRCHHCGYQLDAAMGFNNSRRPKPGDFSVCAGCGHVMVFADNLSLRVLTAEEVKIAAHDAEVLTARLAILLGRAISS